MVRLGLDGDRTFAAPTLNATIPPFHFSDEGWERIAPNALIGAGLGVVVVDDAPNDKTSVGFLIDVGMGIESRVTDHVDRLGLTR